MIRLAFYFGIGALLHLAFVGSHFDFNSAWTWLWLFGWPFMFLALIASAGVFVCLAIAAAISVCAIFAWSTEVVVSAKGRIGK